jgi:glutamate dehydrogenase
MTETLNPFINAQRQIKKACNMYKSCKNNENQYELLSHPRRILKINIPVRMDN